MNSPAIISLLLANFYLNKVRSIQIFISTSFCIDVSIGFKKKKVSDFLRFLKHTGNIESAKM